MYDRALIALAKGKKWEIRSHEIKWITDNDGNEIPDPETFIWRDESAMPSRAAIEAEALNQRNLWEQNLYQEKRAREYPSLKDLADAMYWQQNGDESKMIAYLAACEAVKLKYPKGV
jgi:hypothetical protein